MSKPKLTYFDFDGGRAEATRLTLAIGGIDFEDHRISFEEFGKMRTSTPLNAVPVIEIDGEVYTQSNAMTRYFGKQAGLYPDGAWDAFRCDEILEAIEDATQFTVRTFGLEGDALKSARAKLADTFTTFLKFLDKRLAAGGGEFFVENRLTIADLKVFTWIRGLKSGTLDHIPVDLTDTVAPQLVAHLNRVSLEPGVTAYYQSRKKNA